MEPTVMLSTHSRPETRAILFKYYKVVGHCLAIAVLSREPTSVQFSSDISKLLVGVSKEGQIIPNPTTERMGKKHSQANQRLRLA